MKTFLVGVVLVLSLVVLLLWPFAILWAVNTLVGTVVVPYTLWNWLAVVVLNISTFGGLRVAIKRKQS